MRPDEPPSAASVDARTIAPESLLMVRGLAAGYDGLPVVRDVTLHVDPGEVVTMLGPNGAGKTTTLATIAGSLAPISGDVEFLGASVGGVPAHRLAVHRDRVRAQERL